MTRALSDLFWLLCLHRCVHPHTCTHIPYINTHTYNVHIYTYIKRLVWRIMGNKNILIFQNPFRFVSIYFFLSWLSQEREETWRKRGHRCPWQVSYHATHQPCLSRSAQLQGPSVRCRIYLGYATSWPEVHSLFHAEMNMPNPGSAPRPALGLEWGSALPRLAKTSAKMLLKAQLEPRALLYPPHSTSGWVERVKDDSISTLGHPMSGVARCDRLHAWAFGVKFCLLGLAWQ